MQKLNQDLLFSDIYVSIRQKVSIDFIANRTDIGFDNIENDSKNINFSIPFRLPEFQALKTIIDLLLRESVGVIKIEPYDKLRLLVKVFGGEIFYRKIGEGNEWYVMIIF